MVLSIKNIKTKGLQVAYKLQLGSTSHHWQRVEKE